MVRRSVWICEGLQEEESGLGFKPKWIGALTLLDIASAGRTGPVCLQLPIASLVHCIETSSDSSSLTSEPS